MNYEVNEEEMAWLSNCYVGIVHNPNVVYLLQDRILMRG